MLAAKTLRFRSFFLFQLALLSVGAVVASGFGRQVFQSFLAGAGIMLAGNMILLSRFLLRGRNFAPGRELMIMYACAFLKLVVIIAGTIAVAMTLQPDLLCYIGGLLLLQVAVWLMPLFIR